MMKFDHSWLIAEWERMGRPTRQVLDPDYDMWLDLLDDDCDFFSEAQYRIKCKPWINWEHLSDDMKWMATDKNGYPFLYSHGPKLHDEEWFLWNCYTVYPFLSFTPGTCDWKDSLVMRPVVIID